jgi:orotidine-5'-phosphate decarboxylase
LKTARDRLAYPLDYASLDDARRGAALVSESFGVLKVGLQLFVSEGPPAARIGAEFSASVFLDLKLHDIPETVERAVASAADLGVRYLTLHASGGPRMLERAAERVAKSASGIVLLGVTVLTSLDAADLDAVGVAAEPADQTLRLARLAVRSGLGGLVCSPAEVATLRRELGPSVMLVTPGIRPGGSAADDQKRTGTPGQAIRAGASLLVVGRPVRDAADPRAAAAAVLDEVSEATRDGAS